MFELNWEKNGTELVATGTAAKFRIETTKGKRFKLHLTDAAGVERQIDPAFTKKTEAVAAAQKLETEYCEMMAAQAEAARLEAEAKAAAELAAAEVKRKELETVEAGPEPTVRSRSGMKIISAIAGCPVPFPNARTDEALTSWIETLRDAGEAEGKHFTAIAIGIHAASLPGVGETDARRVKHLLRHQMDMERRAEKKGSVSSGEPLAPGNAEAKEPGTRKPAAENGNVAASKPLEVNNAFAEKIPVVASEGKGGGRRFTVWDMPVTGVLRWMGANGYTVADARAVMNALGLSEVKDPTLQAQIRSGAKGEAGSHGPVPHLTAERGAAIAEVFAGAK